MNLNEKMNKAWRRLNNIGIYTIEQFNEQAKKEFNIGFFTESLIKNEEEKVRIKD